MLIKDLLAAGSRDEKRCLEPLHISEVIRKLQHEAYPLGATDVPTKEELWLKIMHMSQADFLVYSREQHALLKAANERMNARYARSHTEACKALDLQDCELCEKTYKIESDFHFDDKICNACDMAIQKQQLEAGTYFPDMAYEGENYHEPNWDDEPLAAERGADYEKDYDYGVNPLHRTWAPVFANDEPDELPF